LACKFHRGTVSNKHKIGARVNEQTYEQFKEWVRNRHGHVRGTLSTELEAAIENHMAASRGPDEVERMEQELSTIKAQMADIYQAVDAGPDADGGEGTPVPTPSNGDDGHTHTDDGSDGVSDGPMFDAPASKPHPKGTVGQKARWVLADEGLDPSGGGVTREILRDAVVDAWALNADAAEGVVDAAVRVLERDADAACHPAKDTLYLWGDPLTEARQALQDDADDELDALDDAA